MAKSKNMIPLFLLPETVVFPEMNLPLHIFEERYKTLVSDCLKKDNKFGIALARANNLCAKVGTIVEIVDVENLEDGLMNILIEGKERFEILSFLTEEPYHVAEILPYEDTDTAIDEELEASLKEIKKLTSKALKTLDLISDKENSRKIRLPKKPIELLYLIATNLTCSPESKQTILETRSIKERTEKIEPLLHEEIQKLNVMLENKKTKKSVETNGKLKIH